MQSLIAAQQLLTSANSGLTAAQQQQLLAQMSSSLSQLSAAQQQQLLASLMGSTSMGSMGGMTSRYVMTQLSQCLYRVFSQQWPGQSGGRRRRRVGPHPGPAAAASRRRDESDQCERGPGQGVLGQSGHPHGSVPGLRWPLSLRPLSDPTPPVLDTHRARGALPLTAARH